MSGGRAGPPRDAPGAAPTTVIATGTAAGPDRAGAPGVLADPEGCLGPHRERRRRPGQGELVLLLVLAALLALAVGCGDGGGGADGAAGGGAAGDAPAAAPGDGAPGSPAGSAGASGRDGSSSARRPHVLLISVDTLRADRLGCYGNPRETSPWIDSLAARGLRLSRVQAQATMTLASHASLFTSLYPPQFALVRADGENVTQASTRLRLPEAVTTLAEVLAGAGYATAAFTGGALVDPRYGLGQGFEHFQAAGDLAASGLATSVPWLLSWLDEREAAGDERPRFLFLHSFDVHDPYDAPEPFAERFSEGDAAAFEARHGLRPDIPALTTEGLGRGDALRDDVIDLYDNGLAAADAALAELERELTARGLWDQLVVVLVSDHGEEFAEHGGWGHGPRPVPEVLHVPWILRLPGDARAGTVLDDPAALLDVGPTLVELLDLPAPEGWRGLSQWPRLTGAAPAPSEPRWLYADNQYAELDRRRVQRGDEVLVLDYSQFAQQLYDRSSDPGEQRNLSAERPDRADALRQEFEAWLGRLIQSSRAYVAEPMPAGSRTHWEAQQAMLEALGYTR